MSKKLILIFLSAFLLNFLWEEAHSVLYLHDAGEPMTHLMLLRAALFDAAVIAIFSCPFLGFESLKGKRWLLYVVLVIFAVILEKWGLSTGRWMYTDTMPLLPFLNIGLPPVIQLGLLGYSSSKISDFFTSEPR